MGTIIPFAGSMINQNGGQTTTSNEVTFTKEKSRFESGLSSCLINEEILRKRCLRSMDDEIKIAGGTTLAMFLAGKKERKHRGPDEKKMTDLLGTYSYFFMYLSHFSHQSPQSRLIHLNYIHIFAE